MPELIASKRSIPVGEYIANREQYPVAYFPSMGWHEDIPTSHYDRKNFDKIEKLVGRTDELGSWTLITEAVRYPSGRCTVNGIGIDDTFTVFVPNN